MIYTDIRKASPRSGKGILHRLALGTAVQHAVPVAQRNAVAKKDAPTVVDPVKRYLHYEKAYLAGELDPAFEDMSAWECRLIVADAKPAQLGARGTELGEANESAETKAMAVEKATVTEADKQVAVGSNGVITIPAAACSGRVSQMKSFLGGLQAFCGDAFSCEVDVPNPGKYRLTARVVTVHPDGQLQLTANQAKDPVAISIPYTCGKWETTQPVEVTLVEGKNVLGFSKPERGFTLKDITLTPVK